MAYGMLKLQLRLRLVAGPFAGREPPHRGSQRPFQRLSSGLVCVLALHWHSIITVESGARGRVVKDAHAACWRPALPNLVLLCDW